MGAYLGDSRNLMIYNMLIIKAKSWGLILNIIILFFLDLLSSNLAGDL